MARDEISGSSMHSKLFRNFLEFIFEIDEGENVSYLKSRRFRLSIPVFREIS